jgi:ferredoxin-nitrite reductase
LIRELDEELALPNSVRIHWTGCPNSCGQPQVADIGLMGTKVRKDGKTVEGVDLYMGGKVGKHAVLGTCVQKSIPCEDLKPVLIDLLIQNFGAQIRTTPLKTSAQIQFSVEEEVVPSPVAAVNGAATFAYQPVAVEIPAPSAPPAQAAIASFAKSGKEVACTEADTLLDVATQAGVELDSSCQAGTCGTCKQRLLEGQVQYEGEPDGLDASEQAAGWILTCIAHPIGKVVIDA